MAGKPQPGDRLRGQVRELPDQPGVYLFKDAAGQVVYVGKAKSVRKRVTSHFSGPASGKVMEMRESVDSIESVVVNSEVEALLVEQTFIKRHRPKFNIRLRDDKSYPFIGISLDERYPRVYFTRERHRRDRVYFGPYANARRVRETLDVLGKVFMFRTCDGAEPGRRSGSPCLDFHIKRCEAPCIGEISEAAYRERIDGVIAFLAGRHAEIEASLEAEMAEAAAAQRYEDAARARNRLSAARSLLERQPVAGTGLGSLDVIAVAVGETDANAQVLQVREGMLADRLSFYLDNPGGGVAEVAEAFIVQHYDGTGAIPPLVIVQQEFAGTEEAEALAGALAERRGAKVEIRTGERGDRRSLLGIAQRNADLALGQERLRAEGNRRRRTDALDGLARELGMADRPVRIECFDISHLMGTETVASMVVFEGGEAAKADYRRFRVRDAVAGAPDEFAAMEEVLGRRLARWEAERKLEPTEHKSDTSFSALPDLIVIDGGKGQLSAGMRALEGFVERGVRVVSLAKRIEEVFVPESSAPLVLDRSSPELQLLQRVRDEAHRFALEHHRGRRSKAMTASALDGLPGIGPARRRMLVGHFGSVEAVLAASREQLEAVPGLPGKVARDLHSAIHRLDG